MYNEELMTFAMEIFSGELMAISEDYSTTCTSASIGIEEAFEVYETACLVGTYESISLDSAEDKVEKLKGVYEASGSNLLTKIVKFIKEAIAKLKEIGSKIKEHIVTFIKFMGAKLSKLRLLSRYGSKIAFRNGFHINLESGFEQYNKFAEGVDDMLKDMTKVVVEVGNTKTPEELAKWAERNKAYTMLRSPKEELNDYMKCKIKLEDSPMNWVQSIFEYKPVDGSFVPSMQELKSWSEVFVNQKYTTLFDNCGESIMRSSVDMNNTCRIVEKNADNTTMPEHAQKIKLFSQRMISYSEIGVSVSSATVSFVSAKLTTLINYLVGARVLVKKN